MSDVEYPIKGACQCGGVTYELLAPPAMVVACHCRECQKLSTSAFSITAMVDADSIRFSGEMREWSRPAESGNISAAKFCPCCGNRLYHFNPDEPERSNSSRAPSAIPGSSIRLPTSGSVKSRTGIRSLKELRFLKNSLEVRALKRRHGLLFYDYSDKHSVLNLNLTRLHCFWYFMYQIHMQQPVFHRRFDYFDMICQLEAAFKVARGDALIKVVAVLWLLFFWPVMVREPLSLWMFSSSLSNPATAIVIR